MIHRTSQVLLLAGLVFSQHAFSLSIDTISPNAGIEAGGTIVTITGAEVSTVTEVTIGGKLMENLVVLDSESVTGNIPAGNFGKVDVVVSNNSDSATLVDGFTYKEGVSIANNALSFDGNDVVTFGTVSPLTEHTIEAWVKPVSTAAGVIVGHIAGPSQACGFGFLLHGGGSSLLYGVDPAGCGTSGYIGDTADRVDQWTHVAGTFQGAMQKLYINGVLVNQDDTASFAPSSWMTAGAITFFNGQQQYFHGLIEEIRVWSVARTSHQIRQAMNRDLTGDEDNLVGYWRFDEGVGQSTVDDSVNNVAGILGSSVGVQSNDPTWIASDAPIYTGIDLAIALSDNVDSVKVNSIYDYTMMVTNVGEHDATGVHMTDVLPLNVSVVSLPQECSGTTVLTCSLKSIAVGEFKTVIISIKAINEGTVTNIASVEANQIELDDSNNSDEVTTVINVNSNSKGGGGGASGGGGDDGGGLVGNYFSLILLFWWLLFRRFRLR